MPVLVVEMRKQGKALSQTQIRQAQPICAQEIVVGTGGAPPPLGTGGRQMLTAWAQGSGAGGPLLPPLYQCTLSWMAGNGFVLGGLEVVEDVVYAQSWWCQWINGR